MAQVMVMTGSQRRRRWTNEERRQILEASFAHGAIAAGIARQYEISTSLIYKWRREVKAARSDASFLPPMIADVPAAG